MNGKVVRAAAPWAAMLVFVVLGAGPAGAATVTVNVFDFEFSVNPPGQPVVDPTIRVGDTIRWQFASSGHTSTSVRGIAEQWDSGFVSAGSTFSHTFRNLGTFEYYCQPHGFDQGNGRAGGMAGKVTVMPEPGAAALTGFLTAVITLRRPRRARAAR